MLIAGLLHLWFAMTTSAFSYAFNISEIFSNPQGKSKTYGYQWVELYNSNIKRIWIESLRLAISVGKKNDIVFNEKIEFLQKISFDDFLLIAQDELLGFDKCLKIPVIVIKNKEYIIPKDKKFSICVSINESPLSCAHLTTKDKFSDGRSLYFSEQPEDERYWLEESCEWRENTWATPGLKAQICNSDKNFTEDIFDECRKKSNVNIFPIKADNKSIPIIRELIKRDNYELIFNDEDRTDIWSVRYCKYDDKIKNLCEELNPRILKFGYYDQIFTIEKIPFYVKIRDLYGLENKVIQK